jgi:hypothetical protein
MKLSGISTGSYQVCDVFPHYMCIRSDPLGTEGRLRFWASGVRDYNGFVLVPLQHRQGW